MVALPSWVSPERTRWIGRLTLLPWFVIMAVVSATLLSRHLIALPRPNTHGPIVSAIARLRRPEDRNRWLAVHALDANCRCSMRIARHLVDDPRPGDLVEHVLWT